MTKGQQVEPLEVYNMEWIINIVIAFVVAGVLSRVIEHLDRKWIEAMEKEEQK